MFSISVLINFIPKQYIITHFKPKNECETIVLPFLISEGNTELYNYYTFHGRQSHLGVVLS